MRLRTCFVQENETKTEVFGFVRYPKEYDVEETLVKLKNIWTGSYRLRAFTPRFNRKPLNKRSRAPNLFLAGSGLRKERRSFIDLVKGVQKIDRVETEEQYVDDDLDAVQYKTK